MTTASTPIETPCINVCVIDTATRRCAGCGRTGEEIGSWTAMSAPARRAVMERLAKEGFPNHDTGLVAPWKARR